MMSQSSKFGLSDQHFPDFMRRFCDYRQMDFEAAFDQLFYLLSADPQKVYVLWRNLILYYDAWIVDIHRFITANVIFTYPNDSII